MDNEHLALRQLMIKTGLNLGAIIASKTLYDSIFKRLKRPDYSLKPGLYDYSRYGYLLPRELIMFPSKRVQLEGYYYKAEKPLGLVLFVHGFKSGADDYLPIYYYLVKNNFSVFSYDGRGVYSSEGKNCVGFCQTLIDVESAITFLQKDKRFKKMPLFLLGHSCGGYAVNSVLALKKNIKACASIGAMNDAYKIVLEKGLQYGGELVSKGFPKEFLDTYQGYLFGKYTEYTSLKGLNSVTIPILVAHGLNDETIDLKTQSLICHKEEFKNPNVRFYYGDNNQGGHCSIWHSVASNDYQKEVDQTLKEMKHSSDEKKREYIKTVNHYLYSEINYTLFDQIINLYKDALTK